MSTILNISGAPGSTILDIGGIKEVNIFAPANVFFGISYSNNAITIPIESLSGLTAEKANAYTGNWQDIVQSIFLTFSDYLYALTPTLRPMTVRAFVLENWNRSNKIFGRHMKRYFLFEFVVNNPPTNIFDPEE